MGNLRPGRQTPVLSERCGAYVLRQRGSIALPVAGRDMINDPFQDPVLFLVPALGISALALFVVRILPLVMIGIAWLVTHTRSVGLLLASRHLARTPGLYAVPLVLLVLTLSLSVFIASLAQTLDNHLYDQMYYQIGADMSLVEYGQSTESGGGGEPFSNPGVGLSATSEEESPRWLFLPISEHLTGYRACRPLPESGATRPSHD